MPDMECRPLSLAGSYLLRPDVFGDERGYFKEIYSTARYRELGITEDFVQDNISCSMRDVVRGLHADPRMAKLVQLVTGEAFDVIVDFRRDSPTFLRWEGFTLRASEHTQLFVPRGFLHGFLALADETILLYKQSALYDAASEIGIAWDDPDLGIDWPLQGHSPRLSDKDRQNPAVRDVMPL